MILPKICLEEVFVFPDLYFLHSSFEPNAAEICWVHRLLVFMEDLVKVQGTGASLRGIGVHSHLTRLRMKNGCDHQLPWSFFDATQLEFNVQMFETQ